MLDELTFLRDENARLKATIAVMASDHDLTYELNEVLVKRLRSNGLSPNILPTQQELASSNQATLTSSEAKVKSPKLTRNMLSVLRALVDGVWIDHGLQITPRERAGRGRTMDALKEMGLLNAAYKPTEEARSLVANSAS